MIPAGVLAAAIIASVAPLLVPDADAAATRVFTGIDTRSGGDGYLLSSARGEMYAFGSATAVRNPSGFTGDIADVALTADGRGAMAASSTGQFYAYGTARYYGNGDSGCESFSGRAVCHHIRSRYQALGGPGGPLGPPTSGEFGVTNGGLGQHFTTGSIYWSPRTGAWDVRGAIRDKWFSMAAERGVLGMPVGGEFHSNGRWGSRFANGSIYFSGATGAHEVHGEIHRVYVANNFAEGPLGMPLTDEVDGAGDWTGGKASFFVGGSIVWDGRGTRVRELSAADRRAEARTLQAMTLDDFMAVQRGVDKSDTIQWENDGCSGPTDGELDRIFEPACIRHDFGNKSFGPRNLRLDASEASFKRVNDLFRKDLMSICTKNGNPWVTNKKVTVKCGLAADATQRTVVATRRVWWDA